MSLWSHQEGQKRKWSLGDFIWHIPSYNTTAYESLHVIIFHIFIIRAIVFKVPMPSISGLWRFEEENQCLAKI